MVYTPVGAGQGQRFKSKSDILASFHACRGPDLLGTVDNLGDEGGAMLGQTQHAQDKSTACLVQWFLGLKPTHAVDCLTSPLVKTQHAQSKL